MLSGFNTNYRYRGVLFHVQTEDSGIDNPHVITHLFHGGNILASQKLDYASHVGSAELEDVVKGLMESQHKSMLQGLRGGLRDEVIRERLGADALEGAGSGDTDATYGKDQTDTALPDGQPLPPEVAPTPESATETTLAAAAPAHAPADGMDTPQDRLNRAFGEGIVSQKPLDEVVLEYLVENARKRKRRPQ